MIVKLNKKDIKLAHKVASQRNSSQRGARRSDGKVMRSSINADQIGAEGELAVSKGLGAEWDGKFYPIEEWDKWKVDGHDVGMLEVRTTRYKTGRLIIHDKDQDYSPYILVLSYNCPEFFLAGWCFGNFGKNKKYWREDVPRPCYMVPQSDLRPMDELINFCGEN